MSYAQRVELAKRMLWFSAGVVFTASAAFAVWVTWGRDAVRAGASAQCERQEDAVAVAETCAAWWFGAEPTEKFDLKKRVCGRPGQR